MADKYGANAEKAYIAGWVHDCAKELSLSEMHDIVNEHSLRLDKYVLSSKALLHGPVGSILCETKYGIDDKDIKSAIFYHTTGRTNMTLLEKIIFLADYIEPSRDFPGVDTIRKLAEKDLNQAVLSAYNSTIKHLIDQDAYIYDLTFLGRNDMVLLIDGEMIRPDKKRKGKLKIGRILLAVLLCIACIFWAYPLSAKLDFLAGF